MPELIDSATLEHPTQDPPWTKVEFYELVGQMVTMSAPRLFAIGCCPLCPARISSLGNTRDDQHP